MLNYLLKSNNYFNKITYKQKKRVSSYSPENQIDILIEAYKISTGKILCLLYSDDFFLESLLRTSTGKEIIENPSEPTH